MKTCVKNRKGQALVEFAMTFGIYTAFMLLACDFASVAYQWTILQYSANQGARIGSLGYIQNIDPNNTDGIFSSGTDQTIVNEVASKSNNTDRIDTIKSVVVVTASKFGIALTKDNVKVLNEGYGELSSGSMNCDCNPNDPRGKASSDTVGEKLMYVRAEKDFQLPVLSSTIQSLLGIFNPDNPEIKCHLVGEALTRNEPFNYTPTA